MLLLIFFSSNSLRAQIENIYDSSGDDVAGINALMSATTSNDVNGVRFFSKAGRALINQKNLGGATALHLACREGYFDIAKILIDSGADVNIADNEGWTPLMRASLVANPKIVELLISRDAQASALNSVGESAIIHATTSDCNDCLNIMFEKYNFIRVMDIKLLKDQLTDSFIIARNRENEIAQDLLAAYLDQVIKMSPLIEKEKKEEREKLQTAPSTIFKITSDDAVVTTRTVISESSRQEKIEQPIKTTTKPAQSFNSKPQKTYKFNGEKKLESQKSAAQESEKIEEVIIPIRKSDDVASPEKQTSSAATSFKFTGKKQQNDAPKVKFIPKVKKVKSEAKIKESKSVAAVEKQAAKISETALPKKVETIKKSEEKQLQPAKIETVSPVINSTINIVAPNSDAASAIEKTKIISPQTQPEKQDSSKTKVKPKFIIGVLPEAEEQGELN